MSSSLHYLFIEHRLCFCCRDNYYVRFRSSSLIQRTLPRGLSVHQQVNNWKWLQGQLTLEQRGFERHGSTYTRSFSVVNVTTLHDLQLVDSKDAEPHMRRVGALNLHVVQGSAAIKY